MQHDSEAAGVAVKDVLNHRVSIQFERIVESVNSTLLLTLSEDLLVIDVLCDRGVTGCHST
jgi:hypothetical protein